MPFCCERHENTANVHSPGFQLQTYLPSPLFATTGTKRKDPGPRSKTRYRKKADRKALDLLLISWVLDKVENDVVLMRESIDILSKDQRKRLIFMNPKDITSRHDITRGLDEDSEWADEFSESLFVLVKDYDKKLVDQKHALKSTRKALLPATRPQVRSGGPPETNYSSDNDHSDADTTQEEFREGSSADSAPPISTKRSVRPKLSH